MRWLGVAIVSCWLAVFAAPASAGDQEDFNEAVRAYKAGDYQKAFRLLKPLAEKGYSQAQFNLGSMYQDGQGVPQDYVKAYAWYSVSATQGYKDAKHNLDILVKILIPAQLAKGQELAAEY